MRRGCESDSGSETESDDAAVRGPALRRPAVRGPANEALVIGSDDDDEPLAGLEAVKRRIRGAPSYGAAAIGAPSSTAGAPSSTGAKPKQANKRRGADLSSESVL